MSVRLYAELNEHLPREIRQLWIERELDAASSVGDLLRDLGVPAAEVDLVLVDGASASLVDRVRDDARVSAYPVFERFDIGPLTRVRERPLRAPRFAAAPGLGRLALALRLLGLEARLAPPGWKSDPGPGGEILLTPDPSAPGERGAVRAIVVRERRAAWQAREVLQALQLEEDAGRAPRCLGCGAEAVVPRCGVCGRVARGSSFSGGLLRRAMDSPGRGRNPARSVRISPSRDRLPTHAMTIGLPLLKDSLDSPLSQHFGKAKWLLIYDCEGQYRFVRNTGLTGHSVAQELAAAGCTDLIILHAGGGAWGHLQQKGMRVWQGEADVPARELIRRAGEGELARAEPPGPGDPAHGGHCSH